ncbi:hypothetical protein Y032_0009g631 [Ancylostoma ceylanicum]|uniref:Uncharacterized protein n=1 Tax=Ancylostoma ceylanicum TaxID=53326 RepID=A0A016VJ13_9BILA|nr:hypothetical protein Y032_0009g631 [Ancylostoma ceylanicum]
MLNLRRLFPDLSHFCHISNFASISLLIPMPLSLCELEFLACHTSIISDSRLLRRLPLLNFVPPDSDLTFFSKLSYSGEILINSETGPKSRMFC